MKKINILGNVFEFEDGASDMMSEYISRIDNYIESKKYSAEIATDIKYRIIEKLYISEKPITETTISQIIKTIGEPENIFDEETVQISESKYWIDRDKPIIWWVCYWIAKTLKIPAIWVRILFVAMIFAGWLWLWLYVVLAFFTPYKDKQNTTGSIWGAIFWIIKTIFWLIVLWRLFGMILGMFGISTVLFFTPSMDNQSIIAIIPEYMYWVVWVIIFCLLILFLGALGGLFRTKLVWKNLAIISTVMIVIAGAISWATVYKITLQILSNTQTVSQSFVLTWWNTSGNTIYFDVWDMYHRDGNVMNRLLIFGNQDIVAYDGLDVTIKVETHVRWLSQEENQNQVKLLNPLILSGYSNYITMRSPDNTFQKIVPFAFVNRNITIYIPKNKEISINNRAGVRFLWLKNYYRSINNNDFYECIENSSYIYNNDRNQFVCKNTIQNHESDN